MVTVIITAMTEAEKKYIPTCLTTIDKNKFIDVILICVEKSNAWIDDVIENCNLKNAIEVIRLDLLPQSIVRNYATNLVKSEYIAFCDGDDFWHETKLEEQLRYLKEKDADLVGCDHILVNESNEKCAYSLAKYIPMPSSWLVKTSVMKKSGFNEELKGTEDSDWWWNRSSDVKKIRLSKFLINYTVRSNSSSSIRPSKRRKEKVVRWSSKSFLLKAPILFATYMAWLINKRSYYRLYDYNS